MKRRILIAEDDKKIARLEQLLLESEGYETDIAGDGKEALEKIEKGTYDLIILDIMMPKINGIEVCRQARKFSKIPIIIVSAKDETSDKVIGLDFGADDYITKPFVNEEFIARVKAMFRRIVNINALIDEKEEILKNGLLTINQSNYTVDYDGNEIILTKKEFELLEYLLINKGIVLKRDKILYDLWGMEHLGNDNLLDLYIKYLRDKIDKKFNNNVIHTVRGIGFTIKKESQSKEV